MHHDDGDELRYFQLIIRGGMQWVMGYFAGRSRKVLVNGRIIAIAHAYLVIRVPCRQKNKSDRETEVGWTGLIA